MSSHIRSLHLHDQHALIVYYLGRPKMHKVPHHMRAHVDLKCVQAK